MGGIGFYHKGNAEVTEDYLGEVIEEKMREEKMARLHLNCNFHYYYWFHYYY